MTIKARATIVAMTTTVLALTFVCGRTQAAYDEQATIASLKAILASPHRPAKDKARDQYRHPIETLTYFGIRPNMTVVEVWPGEEGWYTQILAPFLKEHGKLYDVFRTGPGAQHFKQLLAMKPTVYSRVIVTEHGPPETTRIAPAGTADMVLTFRNVHNWMNGNYAAMMFKAIYLVLKPGGILGVVEHRGNPAVPQDPKAGSGYVREDFIIKMAQDAGLQLVGKSEINANPKDTKDYPAGVWALPPTLKLKAKDRQKYLAIGESDRMTLKFTKPLVPIATPVAGAPSAAIAEPGAVKSPTPAQKP